LAFVARQLAQRLLADGRVVDQEQERGRAGVDPVRHLLDPAVVEADVDELAVQRAAGDTGERAADRPAEQQSDERAEPGAAERPPPGADVDRLADQCATFLGLCHDDSVGKVEAALLRDVDEREQRLIGAGRLVEHDRDDVLRGVGRRGFGSRGRVGHRTTSTFTPSSRSRYATSLSDSKCLPCTLTRSTSSAIGYGPQCQVPSARFTPAVPSQMNARMPRRWSAVWKSRSAGATTSSVGLPARATSIWVARW